MAIFIVVILIIILFFSVLFRLPRKPQERYLPTAEERRTEIISFPEQLAEQTNITEVFSKEGSLPLELDIKEVEEPTNGPALDFTTEEVVLQVPLSDYEPLLDLRNYQYPTLDLLKIHGHDQSLAGDGEIEANKNRVINTLKNYDIDIQRISATVGPNITLYEVIPASGVRVARIKNLEDDIAMALATPGIRIIAPLPGKNTIGIEIPNIQRTIVGLRLLLASDKFQQSSLSLPIAIGKDIDNEVFVVDLASMPHLLMVGAAGQGKSVGLNVILLSLLHKKHPSQLKLVLLDPTRLELSAYRTLEKHFLARLPGEEEVILTKKSNAIRALNGLCIEMDNRYDLLAEGRARNIGEYNTKFIKRRLNPQKGHQYLPFIVLVINEYADLISPGDHEVEMPVLSLVRKGRAVGIHLILVTKHSSTTILPSHFKDEFLTRMCFRVYSKKEARSIMNTEEVDQLLDKGDMLISYDGKITRLQGALADSDEVEAVTAFIGNQRGYPEAYQLPEYVDEKDLGGKLFELDLGERDPLFEEAARLIVQNQIGSTALIQRRMKLGYNRAGRLMDQLEAFGVVGPGQGSKPRDVLMKSEHELESYLNP